MTDTEIRVKGVEILSLNLGKVEAERFLSLINREVFDYTAWQRELWQTKSIDDIAQDAKKFQEFIETK